jgi:hypothetical protein
MTGGVIHTDGFLGFGGSWTRTGGSLSIGAGRFAVSGNSTISDTNLAVTTVYLSAYGGVTIHLTNSNITCNTFEYNTEYPTHGTIDFGTSTINGNDSANFLFQRYPPAAASTIAPYNVTIPKNANATFTSGDTVNIGGLFKANGTLAQPTNIKASTTGVYAGVNSIGTDSFADGVTVTDIDSSGGNALYAIGSSGSHYLNWLFVQPYTLTYTAGANGNILGVSPQLIPQGGNGAAVTASPDAHYHFVNWDDMSVQNPRTDTNVQNNISVTANFSVDTFTLNYTAGAHGHLLGPTPQIVNYGGNGSAITAIPDAHYAFLNWTDASTQNPRTETNVTANVTVTANFYSLVPSVTSPSTASSRPDLPFHYKIVASNSPTSYNASGLPSGLSVNTITGVISGSPTAAGVTNSTIYATNIDGTGNSALQITSVVAVTYPLADLVGLNTGTLYTQSGRTPWSTGRFGSRSTFNGIDEYSIMPAASIPSSGSFSIPVWFRPDETLDTSTGTARTILRYSDSNSNNDIALVIPGTGVGDPFDSEMTNLAGYLVFRMGNSVDFDTCNSTASSWTSGVEHVAIVWYDASTRTMKLYVDNTLQNTTVSVHPRGSNISTLCNIGSHTSKIWFFKGLVEQIRVYPYAISNSEINFLSTET